MYLVSYMVPSAGLTLLLTLLMSSSAWAAGVPDCLGRRCGPTELKRVDVGVAVIHARATRTADDMAAIEQLYALWAEEERYLMRVEQARSRSIRILHLRPEGASERDETVVTLERVDPRGTDITVTGRLELRPRQPPPRAPAWVPTCGGCEVVTRFDHGDNQVVMLEGPGQASHGMRRQAAAMRSAGWRAGVEGTRPRFPTDQITEEFYTDGRACMAVASSASRNRFHISLMCGRTAAD